MGKTLQFKIPTEHQSQATVVAWARDHEVIHPELWLLYAVPNGYKMSAAGAGKSKREGIKSGVPDLCLPVAQGHSFGLYIEMKKKGGRVSDQQQLWIDALTHQGYRVAVCFSAHDAINEIKNYLGIK